MKILLLLLSCGRRHGRKGRRTDRGQDQSGCSAPEESHPALCSCRCVGSDRGHVGEYGRTPTPSHDQPVCFDGGLRRGPGEAAPPGGPLAVRDGAELLLPGGQHPQSPPPDDVHTQKHPCHAPQLPRRYHHVLQAAGIRLQRRRPLPGIHGMLPAAQRVGFRLLLGIIAAWQPPGRGMASSSVAHKRPHAPLPPHPADAHVAPWSPAQWLPAAPCGVGTPRPKMRHRGAARG